MKPNSFVEQNLSKWERIVRTVLWASLELFVFGTAVGALAQGKIPQALFALGTVVLLLAPFLLSKLLKFEMNTLFFCYCLLYAVGPMLGSVYKLYYLTDWWDDLLHASGGVVFAIVGVYLAELLNGKNPPSFWLKATFALFFSIAIAGLWELVEYGLDQFFHTDMQNDRVIYDIYSYLLGETPGEVGVIPSVTDVTVNGAPLGVGGYLDIGLHDTMSDVLLETLGAIVLFIVYLIDRDRHPIIYAIKKEETHAKTESV